MIYHLALTAMNVCMMSNCVIGVPFQIRMAASYVWFVMSGFHMVL